MLTGMKEKYFLLENMSEKQYCMFMSKNFMSMYVAKGLLNFNYLLFQTAKKHVSPNGEPISFFQRVGMAAGAGACGGLVGTPGDMINVRMQNDIKLPTDQRRK